MENSFKGIKPLEINQSLSLIKRYIFLAKCKFNHITIHPINIRMKIPIIMSEVTKTRNSSTALSNRVRKLSPGDTAYIKSIDNAKTKLRKWMSLLTKMVSLFILDLKLFIRILSFLYFNTIIEQKKRQ